MMRAFLWLLPLVALVLAKRSLKKVDNDNRCQKTYKKPRSKEHMSERQPLFRTIRGSCKADVGFCPAGSCRYNLYRHRKCPDDGIVCPKYRSEVVNCGVFGRVKVHIVDKCVCCADKGVFIKGLVKDSNSGQPLPKMIVFSKGKQVDITSATGNFEFLIGSDVREVVILVKEKYADEEYGEYADAVKTINIPIGFRGPVNVEIPMLKRAAPVSVDPTIDTALDLLPGSNVAKMVIKANSLKDAKGNVYDQIVLVRITSINVSVAETDDILPGRFLTADNDQLVSDLVFEPIVTTADGETLFVEALIKVNDEMLLWEINIETGLWEKVKTRLYYKADPAAPSRKPRQIQLTDAYLFDINSGNWYNIDKIPGAPRCYFKARVFYENPAEANLPAAFRPTVVAFTPNNERLRFYHPFTTDPANECFEVRCLDFNPADPTSVLTGLISYTAYESVSVGGVNIPLITELKAKILTDYIPPIQGPHSSIFYERLLPAKEQVYVNFISANDNSRPFYADRAVCEATNVARPAFHFYKPALPSYDPIPDDTELCTARIALRNGSGGFIDTLTDLATLPSLTATSIWTSGSNNYYYTNIATLQVATDVDDVEFVQVCITYRCSKPDELTTVYLDIDIPWIDSTNGSTDSAIAHPAFVCKGMCNGPLCRQQNPLTNFDGAFEAPEVPGETGPDFYDGTDTDCDDRTSTESFAYEFVCSARRISTDYLCQIEFTFPWSTEYMSERQPLVRTIRSSCKADVGFCPAGSCRYDLYRHRKCPDDGVVCPKYRPEFVDCGVFGRVKVQIVDKCVCCADKGVFVQGLVKDSDSGEPLPEMIVLWNGKQVEITSATGNFEFLIGSDVREVVIVVRDKYADEEYGEYADAVKTVNIPIGFRGPVNVEIPMLKRAAPVSVDPTIDTALDLLPGSNVAKMVIKANSVRDAKGNVYDQIVLVRITSINVSVAETDDILPGRFLTADNDQLVSDLVFEPIVTTADGETLFVEALIKVNDEMLLWEINRETGRWEKVKTRLYYKADPAAPSRKPRQIQLTDAYLFEINSGNWYNIDKIPGAPRCYFKARVFYENPAEANLPAAFRPTVVAFTPNNERLRFYHPFTTDPANECFEVRCLDFNPADPTSVLTGLISYTAYESVSVGGVNIPLITELKAKILTDYIPPIQGPHSSIFYERLLPAKEQVYVNFISANDKSRPFYADRAVCEATNVARPAFHFYKPALPSYDPIPDDTELCTARIALRNGSGGFIDTLTDLATLPSLTATSIWTSGSNNYYYTNIATLQVATDVDDVEFVQVCITFRCSKPDELTTVYLDIDIPWIDSTNGSTDSAIAHPAFRCKGMCNGPLCRQQNPLTNFDGAFGASEVPGETGPDFYDGTDTDCDDRTSTESFAYEFYCDAKRISTDFLCQIEFTFPWSTEYMSERQPLVRTIRGSCKADVGFCPTGSCRYDLYRHRKCPDDGVVCPKYRPEFVDCGVFGRVKVQIVDKCVCCADKGVFVQGLVKDSDSGEPLPKMLVLWNGKQVDITSATGNFEFLIGSDVGEVVIVVRDKYADEKYGEYADAVKTIDIPIGFRGPVNGEILMLKRAAPVSVDPTIDTALELLPGSNVAKMVIKANSVKDAKGNVYEQEVLVRITSINVSVAETDDILPGRFLTADNDQLVSDLVFEPIVTTADGETLFVEALIKVNDEMLLWEINRETGLWEKVKTRLYYKADSAAPSRKPRQIQLTDAYLFEINSGNWYNIDKIPGAPRCYFKARVFYENPAEANLPAAFRPTVVAFTPNNERLRFYHQFTTDPANECFEVRCLDFNPADPTNVLTGLISYTAYESVSVGGVNIPLVTELKAKILTDYIPPIQGPHSSIFYERLLPAKEQVYVNFISANDNSRPFYVDRAVCEATNVARPAFHFYKPALPSYDPIPDDTELCTARIALRHKTGEFINVLTDLATLPSLTATSVWTSGSNNYFYTDTVTLQVATDAAGVEFVQVCVTYRCSKPDEPSTVYLDIDIPWIDSTNGSTDSAIARPGFACTGRCNGPLCRLQNPPTDFDGAFEAPEVSGETGPDFYDGTDTDCDGRTSTESFAYELFCAPRSRGTGEEREAA
ncbi:uncharacterized protein LOC128216462 isoform X2 [Mya arenaria]|nr:uncharacterized protein LOC128216462 isoform X2 [Mya arenaria]